MTATGSAQSIRKALWDDNPGLVQLLGLCPLLAVTSTFVNGLGLGIATIMVLGLSNLLVSASRRWLRNEIRIATYVLIIASLVTCIELIFKAWFPALDRSLGIFIPLIVTNCAIMARAEVFASKHPILPSIIDGIGMGTGFALLLCVIGAFRELVGHGTIFSRLDLLVGGQPMDGLTILESPFLIAILPPGAFFSLALAVAAKAMIDRRRKRAASFRLPI